MPSRRRFGGRQGQGDTLGSGQLDAPPPRLVSTKQARREERIRNALAGAAGHPNDRKVRMPTLRIVEDFDENGDRK